MQKTICLLPGDGIGPEIVAEAVKVLHAVEKKYGHTFVLTEALIGGAAIDAAGVPLPDATVAACKAADAVFLGAVGGPKWDTIDPSIRPRTRSARAFVRLSACLPICGLPPCSPSFREPACCVRIPQPRGLTSSSFAN